MGSEETIVSLAEIAVVADIADKVVSGKRKKRGKIFGL